MKVEGISNVAQRGSKMKLVGKTLLSSLLICNVNGRKQVF